MRFPPARLAGWLRFVMRGADSLRTRALGAAHIWGLMLATISRSASSLLDRCNGALSSPVRCMLVKDLHRNVELRVALAFLSLTIVIILFCIR